MIFSAAFLLGLSFFVTLFILSPSIYFLRKAGFVTQNYQKRETVYAGLILVAVSTLIWIIVPEKGTFQKHLFVLVLGAWVMLTAGLADDFYGDHSVKGLKGHFFEFMNGRLTTGLFKALTGIILAFVACSVFSSGWVSLLTNSLLVIFCINTFNLLDLRPGRALKAFLSFSFILFAVKGFYFPQAFLLSPVGAAAAYFPYDLKSQAMLGDAGANVLGFILGLTLVWVMPEAGKILLIALLAGLHLYTEKCSLTAYIASNRFLNYIDLLGRPEAGQK